MQERRRRLSPEARRDELVAVAAEQFATQPYDRVQMDEIATLAGVSRALLYRYFATKRDLFAAVYGRAAARLLAEATVDERTSLAELVTHGLDAHLDYFAAHRLTVLAANRELAGDPVVQAIIDDELGELRRRLLDAASLTGHARELASAALHGWLTFVRTLAVDWLAGESISRDEVRAVCLAALLGALRPVADEDLLAALDAFPDN